MTKGPWSKMYSGGIKLIYGPNGERVCKIMDDVVRTKEELEVYIREHHGYRHKIQTLEDIFEEEGDWVREKYENGLKNLSEGKILIFGGIGYGDEGLSNLLKSLGAEITN